MLRSQLVMGSLFLITSSLAVFSLLLWAGFDPNWSDFDNSPYGRLQKKKNLLGKSPKSVTPLTHPLHLEVNFHQKSRLFKDVTEFDFPPTHI